MKQRNRPLVLLSGLKPMLLQEVVNVAKEFNLDLRGAWVTHEEWPVDRPVAGALVGDLAEAPGPIRLRKATCPVVRLHGSQNSTENTFPAVLPDFAACGRLAAEHFAERGFKNVAYWGNDPQNPDADYHLLWSAFRRRSEELGMVCRLKSTAEDDENAPESRQTRRIEALGQWLLNMPKPVGLFSFADFMLVRAMIACAKPGLIIPEEVALLGLGNTVQCELTQVGLSSIDMGSTERVRTALDLLCRLMDGKKPPTKPVMVPPRGIVERASTDVLAVSNPMISKAMRFMWDHMDEDLSVDDIARQVGVVRSTLERAFGRALGRSVIAELQRRRLVELCRLLRMTDEPIANLAPQVGFRTMAHLHRCFRHAFGMSPRQYRVKSHQA